MGDFKYSEPSIRNLFDVIKNTTPTVKLLNLGVIVAHYTFLLAGFNVYFIAALLLCCFTMLVLVSPNHDIDIHFWLFFVVGPGLLTLLFILLIEIIKLVYKLFYGKGQKR